MKDISTTKHCPGMFFRLAALAFILLLIAPAARGQHVTFRGGASTMLYDEKYFPDLYGEGISPVFPSFGAKFGWQSRSGQAFDTLLNHPEYGIGVQMDALSAFQTEKSPGIGNIYSLYGYFDRPVIATRRFSLGYTAALGMGFSFSRLFDLERNPANWLLSIPVNTRLGLGVQAKYYVSKRFFIGAGAFFNHTSNGAVQFPNRGVNAFEFSLLAGMKNRSGEGEQPLETVDDGFRRRFHFDIQLTGGIMSNEAYFEHRLENEGVYDNVHRLKWSLSAGCMYRYSRVHTSGLAADMFVTPFCDEIARYDGRGTDYTPVSVGISVLHEIRYHNVSLSLGLGRYLYDNDGLARNKTFYQLVCGRYYLPSLGNTFVGIVLKAHKFRAAESVQLSVGKRF